MAFYDKYVKCIRQKLAGAEFVLGIPHNVQGSGVAFKFGDPDGDVVLDVLVRNNGEVQINRGEEWVDFLNLRDYVDTDEDPADTNYDDLYNDLVVGYMSYVETGRFDINYDYEVDDDDDDDDDDYYDNAL